MEGIIHIKFKRILNKKVDNNLLEKNPKLFETTKTTLKILCQQIKKYFQDHNIKTSVGFDLK